MNEQTLYISLAYRLVRTLMLPLLRVISPLGALRPGIFIAPLRSNRPVL